MDSRRFYVWNIIIKDLLNRAVVLLYIYTVICTDYAMSYGSSDTLSFVILLYRHGDRSPVKTFPLDVYQKAPWPQGLGQLTKRGVTQAYEVGLHLREAYIKTGFLNETYSSYAVYAESADLDPAISAAQTVLAGLYSGNSSHGSHPDILLQPVPVHVTPPNRIKLFSDFPCPRLQDVDQNIFSSDEVNKFKQEKQDLLDELPANTGLNFTDLFEAQYVADTLYCESEHNLTLSDWAPRFLGEMETSVRPYTVSLQYTSDLQRQLRGGPLIKEYLRLLDSHHREEEDSISDQLKLVLFSSDEEAVFRLFAGLNVEGMSFDRVPYSSLVALEVHQSQGDSNSSVVQVWYRNSSDAPHQLKIQGCDKECPYEEFKELAESLVMVDLDHECLSLHLVILGLDFSDLYTVVLFSMCAGLLVLILLLLFVVTCMRRWRHRRVRKYGRLRAADFPEEMPMMNSFGVGSDLDD